MLERAWDRWRAAHGLAAEPLPPVSSYVGYSIEEPWGRPRVVFGVDAADAEKLATLLQDCAAPQQAVDEARSRIPAQGRAAEANGARAQGSSAQQAAGPVNGFHPVETEAAPEDPSAPDRIPEGAPASTSDEDLEDLQDLEDLDGLATPDSGSDQKEPSADIDDEPGDVDDEPGQDVGDPQSAGDADDLSDAGHGVADTMAAELAGWAAGELPGQASARLAAWATVGGPTAPSGPDTDRRTGGAAEPIR
jgi:hypothetical protein